MARTIDNAAEQAQVPQVTAACPPKEGDALPGEAVALPVGLRDLGLSAEAAERLREILDDPSYPTHVGKEMPTADASVLLNKPAR